MTEIYCKGDCQFSQNEERYCMLDNIELGQLNGATFHCQQYIKGNKTNPKFVETDIDRARAAGIYAGLRSKV